jgi:four helix bundle protein
MKKYGFENFDTWNNAKELTKQIYIETRSFPKEEIYGMTSQIRRAAISVTCNLAEGLSRFSPKEQLRYTEIAYGSLMEVLSCAIISNDLGFLETEKLILIRQKIDEISNKLNALKRSITKKLEQDKSEKK